MVQSFVVASKDTTFSEAFEGNFDRSRFHEWRDPFPGAGYIEVTESVREAERCDLSRFEFLWGPEYREKKFRSFQRRQLDEGYAICESPDTLVGTKIIVAFSPWHTAVDAMLCLERAIRRLNQKHTRVFTEEDGTLRWKTYREGDEELRWPRDGERLTDYFLQERWRTSS